MYVLHYCPDFASLLVRIVLNELGQPYETRLQDRAAGEHDSEAYRAMQPYGLIPVLETPDGPIFETAAILLWLADRHGAMAPAPTSTERAAFLKWYFFTISHLHVQYMQLCYPERYVTSPGAEAEFTALAADRVRQGLATLEGLATQAPQWFAPGQASILGHYVMLIFRWLHIAPVGDAKYVDLTPYKALAALAKSLEGRPAARAAAETEGLGDTIYSNPAY